MDHNPKPRVLPKRFLITHAEDAWSRQVGSMEQNGESSETVMMASTIVGGASCLLRNTFPHYFIILYFLGRSGVICL